MSRLEDETKTHEEARIKKMTFAQLNDFWINTPVNKRLPIEASKSLTQKVRRYILELMVEGIETSLGIIYWFTGVEIHDLVCQKFNQDFKKSNTYNHLKILRENELVIDEAIRIKGKRITYFGRTAKFFLFLEDSSEIEVKPKISRFIAKLVGEDESTVEKLLINVFEIVNLTHNDMFDFLEKHYNLIVQIGVKPADLMNIIILIYPFTKDNADIKAVISLIKRMFEN